jgi:hypothetical protein
MPEHYYDRHFPNLKKLGFRKTSEPDSYNCIAYAIGDLTRFWWPGEYLPSSVDYWPPDIPNEATLDAFTHAFATVGYVRCEDGGPEPGHEKVALYAIESEIRHAAKQQIDGKWRSKLGPDEDIEHTLAGLEGPFYGIVVAFLKRPSTEVSSRDKLARPHAITVLKYLLTAGETFGRLLRWRIVVGINNKQLRLIVALLLFLAWMGYLGYAALTRSHSPIVSHSQAAAAEVAVVADVEADPDGKPSMKVKVIETLLPGGPMAGTALFVVNLPDARGFEGPGQYLLLLTPDLPQYYVVGQLRSPGTDPSNSGKPAIYRWNDDVRKQYEKLHR